MPEPTIRTWDTLAVGDEAHFDVTITPEFMDRFAELSGDYNPLHTQERVPYGMIAGAFFSRLVGMHVPGLHSLYLSQTLQFKQPMPVGVPLRISGKVTNMSEATHTITLETTVMSGDTIYVQGEALVKVTHE